MSQIDDQINDQLEDQPEDQPKDRKPKSDYDTGKRVDVLIEIMPPHPLEDGVSGWIKINNGVLGSTPTFLPEHKASKLIVWADAGLEDVMVGVPGVVEVDSRWGSQYFVTTDPRYDVEVVAQEVEATIRCYDPNEATAEEEIDPEIENKFLSNIAEALQSPEGRNIFRIMKIDFEPDQNEDEDDTN